MLSVCELRLVNHGYLRAQRAGWQRIESGAPVSIAHRLPFGMEASGSQLDSTSLLLLFRTRHREQHDAMPSIVLARHGETPCSGSAQK
jgi:hypothetical protein